MGGVLDVFVDVLGVLFFTISYHSFITAMLQNLFLAKTKDKLYFEDDGTNDKKLLQLKRCNTGVNKSKELLKMNTL